MRSAGAWLFVTAFTLALIRGVIACGSELDIDALGSGRGDGSTTDERPDGRGDGAAEGEGDGDAAKKDGASPPGDGGLGSDGDSGFHVKPGQEDGGPWVGTGWQLMTSNATKDLRAVWGATSTAVWAGGDLGAVLFFNGTTWSARASSVSPQGTVWSIRGSAVDDVYLLELRSGGGAFQMFLHHYDGASWSEVGPLPGIGEVGCLDVPARGLAYVYGAPRHSYTPSAADALRLVRIQGVTDAGVSTLGTTSHVSGAGYCNVHAFAPSDVWVTGTPVSRFGGTGFSPLSGAPSSEMLSVVTPSFAFTRLHVWNGATWQSQATGVAGALGPVAGRTSALAFGIVLAPPGRILRYESGGWTQETVPATPALTDIFMAPNGRTFAVGYGGTILTGP